MVLYLALEMKEMNPAFGWIMMLGSFTCPKEEVVSLKEE
jgi:hypothetical protein